MQAEPTSADAGAVVAAAATVVLARYIAGVQAFDHRAVWHVSARMHVQCIAFVYGFMYVVTSHTSTTRKVSTCARPLS